MKNINTVKKSDLTPEQLEAAQKAAVAYQKRVAYQKKRNARPDVKAKRTAYNRTRYAKGREALKLARGLGLLDTK